MVNARPSMVLRQRLTQGLDAAGQRRVTLLVAPAGYGKTTLLAEWAAGQRAAKKSVAWLTLDPYDNAPLRFWSYFAGALRKVLPTLQFDPSQVLQAENAPHDCTSLDLLLNEIARLPAPVAFVLDDYHVITDEDIHQGLLYLIEHQPRNLRLIIASRDNPPIPLTRLRIQGQVADITAHDLAFNHPETDVFLAQVMQVSLPPEQVQGLIDLTEGWITGLQLAALSLRDQSDFKRIPAELPGGNRQVLEFFTEEVLSKQDPVIVEFLLKTSILSDLTAPLCDALLGRSGSQAILEQLERANLFITPLDHTGRWYRYHPLFAGALQVQLACLDEQAEPAARVLPELHRRACAWLRENNCSTQAVAHALAAGEMETAAQIVDSCALQALNNFDMTSLVQWISHFSDEMLRRRPRLGIYDAMANMQLGQFSRVEPKLRLVEEALAMASDHPTWEAERPTIAWEVAAIRAVVARMGEATQTGLAQAARLIASAPDKDTYCYGSLSHWLACELDNAGDLESAATAYEESGRYALTHHLLDSVVYSRHELSRVRKEQGRLCEAEQENRRLLDFTREHRLGSCPAVLVLTGLMVIAIERGDLAAAAEWARAARENIERGLESEPAYLYPLVLHTRFARFDLASGDLASAEKHLENALAVLHNHRRVTANCASLVSDACVRVCLATSGPVEAGRRYASEITSPAIPSDTLDHQAAWARIWLAQGQPDKALPLLANVTELSRQAGAGERLLEALTLQALACRSLGQNDTASARLQEALSLAAPEEYQRPFLEGGEAMHALLVEAMHSGQNSQAAFLSRLLAALRPPAASRPAVELASAPGPANIQRTILDQLSAREQQICQMLAGGSSPKEIAQALVISPNTMKVHMKRIYKKLAIHDRAGLLRLIIQG